MEKYKPAAVEKITGIPTTRIHFFVKSGLISIGDPGRGISRKFSKLNIFELMILDAFRKNGVELSSIRWLFEFVRENEKHIFDLGTYEKTNPPGFFLKVWDGGEKVGAGGERDFDTMERTDIAKVNLSKHQGAVVVNVSALYDRLNDQIRKL